MSFLFKYSAVLQIIKAREHCHRLKREKKKVFKHEKTDYKTCYNALKRLCKKDIEKTALLSEYVNLLITGVKPETADQEMWNFEVQIDLTEEKQQKPFSEKAAERDFEMIIILDKKKKKRRRMKSEL
ncbi:hypothetical protein BDBG_05217 [Blastomyces gilchristii SLH14081]|uniref:Uncharacterized protein n=1 Tax=Blastomyces gilchristii (strain SLH14081) TaxID=559298 RepID=A0A179UNM8_BLAGS|nr:uncharacterized protein BDBG_05217 [Blastomyces gilchristii SLH14081]OAT09433.1 hypothetical protein BDBG_05217 [Blastomyces gilchristii SLH14081]